MRTADFLTEKEFRLHLDRRLTSRRVLILCLFSALCLGGTFAFEWEVGKQERLAEQANAPDPAASQAQADLLRLYDEMNSFAPRLDPLTEHLSQPTTARMIAGLEEALGDSVELERVEWSREVEIQKSNGVKSERSILVLIIDAIALDEEIATTMDQILMAYTGFEAHVENHEPVAKRWPATRMRIRLVGEPGEPEAGI
jgi:hypothetical protein